MCPSPQVEREAKQKFFDKLCANTSAIEMNNDLLMNWKI